MLWKPAWSGRTAVPDPLSSTSFFEIIPSETMGGPGAPWASLALIRAEMAAVAVATQYTRGQSLRIIAHCDMQG